MRTEEQVLSQAPIKVRLGKNDYEIPLLGVIPQRAWREKLAESLSTVIGNFSTEVTRDVLAQGLTGALTKFPDKIVDLVMSYARKYTVEEGNNHLDRKVVWGDYILPSTVLEEATEEQFARAFSEVMSVAFPFSHQLATVTQLMRSQQQ